jgi:hypothetical protein
VYLAVVGLAYGAGRERRGYVSARVASTRVGLWGGRVENCQACHWWCLKENSCGEGVQRGRSLREGVGAWRECVLYMESPHTFMLATRNTRVSRLESTAVGAAVL